MISSPTVLITMYSVKPFLQEAVQVTSRILCELCTGHSYPLPSFEPLTTAHECSAAAGNPCAEDLHIDRRRDPPAASAAAFSSSDATSASSASSHGTVTGIVQRYFIVDSTDAFQKFRADAWERVKGYHLGPTNRATTSDLHETCGGRPWERIGTLRRATKAPIRIYCFPQETRHLACLRGIAMRHQPTGHGRERSTIRDRAITRRRVPTRGQL